MERLGQRDVEALLSYVREVYASSDLEGFASRVVSTLRRVLPSESVSYAEYDLHCRKTYALVEDPPSSDHASEMEVFVRHFGEHPLIDHYRRTGEGQAIKISDFLTQSQWRKRALYNEYFKEIRGIEHQMGTVIPTPGLPVGIALGRSGRDFSERDRQLLYLLRPHLVQAHQNAAALTQSRRDADHSRSAMEGSGRGTMALSDRDRTPWRDERAKRWVEEYFEPARGADRLPETLACWVEHQRSLLSGGGGVPPAREPLIVERPGKRLLVRLAADGPEGETDLLILEERHAPLSAGPLRALGFTAREAEVLIHVAHGRTNREIAATLHVSPPTVKKHLDNVYRKFGVTSRTEALSQALRALDLLS